MNTPPSPVHAFTRLRSECESGTPSWRLARFGVIAALRRKHITAQKRSLSAIPCVRSYDEQEQCQARQLLQQQ